MKCAVIAIIYSKDKSKIFAVKRRDVPLWVLPGGGVDPGKTFEDAIILEIKEKTGFKASIIRQLDIDFPRPFLTSARF
jgi:8-oxo-dGTP pyrophosphatase MutT (NUDIX family)